MHVDHVSQWRGSDPIIFRACTYSVLLSFSNLSDCYWNMYVMTIIFSFACIHSNATRVIVPYSHFTLVEIGIHYRHFVLEKVFPSKQLRYWNHSNNQLKRLQSHLRLVRHTMTILCITGCRINAIPRTIMTTVDWFRVVTTPWSLTLSTAAVLRTYRPSTPLAPFSIH